MSAIPRTVAAVSLLLAAVLSPPAAGAQHFPADEELQRILRYIVEDTGTPGVVLGVLEADGSTRIVSHGHAGPGARPLGPRSQFQVASITKVFTATLLAEMVSRGEVRLEDPVAAYLPDHVTVPSAGDRQITLLDLATHTSALPLDPAGLPLRGANPMAEYTPEDLYAFLGSHQLRGVPGAGYRYSNVGYGLLGHALARAAGMSFRELLRTRIFAPLGMESSDVAVEGELGATMVTGHRGGVPVPHWFATEALQGAGAAVSTAEDLLAFLRAGMGPPATELERAMRSAQEVRVQQGDRGAGWGLHWRTGVFPDGTQIRGAAGQAGGFRSRMAFLPDAQVGVVVLANEVHFAEDLETMLLYLAPPAEGWIDVPVDGARLARYAGTYAPADGDGGYFVRLEDEGHLTIQEPGGARTRLHARSDSTFYTLRGPWSFTFRTEGGAQGATLIAEHDERSRSPERVTRTALRTSAETPPPAEVAGSAEPAARGGQGPLRPAILLLAAILVIVAALGVLRRRRA